MAFKLLVWDFDGTIADTLPAAVTIFNRLAPEMGFKPLEDVNAARGMPTRELMRKHGVTFWRLPKLVRRYQAAVAEEADQLKLIAGMAELLAACQTAGVRQGILSSNREDNIRRCLRANGAEQNFAFIIGYPRLFGKSKALKRIIRAQNKRGFWTRLRAIPKAEKLNRDEVLYIGDELRDVEAAKKVGVKVAAVTWGFHTAELLRSGRPDFVVSDARELLDLVKAEPTRAAG